ncbi:LacI family transcriptional regulator [Propioniciclava sinopodophylli]|uniref:LacI family transcriptional regulator n=1 Tax=Propioniciclava sinopodophylli TaxID=1837344 RepID=A0A4Q9KDR2_9ACTN|nr:LacI family DNA-binding transcriptional regulator [Propioniciclava sinopodophylli]TBT85010.1 LacI family transcriptional regulator [Propioniciclava sinopodophylli]
MTSVAKARLADLAAAAGVSTATVSRVLNGKPGVRPDTRDAVHAAAEAMGYTLEKTGPRRPGPVAIMLPELSNPSFTAFAEILDSLLYAAGVRTFVCPAGPTGMSEDQHLAALLDINLAGIVSVSGIPANNTLSVEPYQRVIASGIPTVFINAPSDELAAGFFSCSDAEAVAASVAHLRTLGHTRIGLAVGNERFTPARRKVAAFRALGFGPDSVATTMFTAEGGQVAAGRLIASGHTAVVCGSDLMALGVVREAHVRGMSVPEDLSVVGFDDSPLMAFTDPGLTTVRQPVRPIAEAAVSALLRAISDGTTPDPTEVLFHPDLIIRRSTGPAPSRPAIHV